MQDEVVSESQPIPAAERELLAGVERRIARAMWALGVAGTILCWLWRGWEWGGGFAIGAGLSALNFRWMKNAAHALEEAASGQAASETAPPRPRGGSGGAVARFVLRYALIGLAGYAIFKSSFVSLGAFFLGLFLFIAAILAEMAYQIGGAFRSE